MPRRFIRSVEPEDSYQQRVLPIDKPWVAYARQSTTRQVEENTESTEAQTRGLMKRAHDRGYDDALGTLYQEGNGIRGVSGRLRIDQRGDLSTVVARIKADEVKTVFITDESRLFRDPTGIQYNTFADICKEHDCLVISDHHIYDFARNEWDIKMWRQRCEASADYIEYHVKGMLKLREQAARRGWHVQGLVSIGYVVDYQKGSPTYRKLIPYEPHAKVVRWLFQRFKELDGNLNALTREVQGKPIFPDTGFPLHTRLKKVVGGWSITRDGLKYLLTNPVYIGHASVGKRVKAGDHKVYQQEIVKRNNHAAIVDEELFFYAYNRLSDVDLDGNPQKRSIASPKRYTPRLTTLPCYALLENRIESDSCPVYVNRGKKAYVVSLSKDGLYAYAAVIKISVLDAVFSEQFIRVVKEDKRLGDGAAYRTLQQAQQTEVRAGMSVEEQLQNIERQIALLRAKMDATDDMELFRTWNTKLNELKALQPKLEKLLKKRDEAIQTEQQYHTLLERIRNEWNRMSFEQKKQAVNTLVDKAVLTKDAPHWYRLVIYWHIPVGRVDEGFIWYRNGGAFLWTEEEEKALMWLYPLAPRHQVQNALPRRTWGDISNRASQLKVKRIARSASDLPDDVAMADLKYAKEHGLGTHAGLQYHATWRTKVGEISKSSLPSIARCL